MHLGLICPELTGHLNPITTLGRELQRRGHRVTVIARPDAARRTQASGLAFAAIAEREFPVGAIRTTSDEIGRLKGLRAVLATVDMLRRGTAAILRDAPDVVKREGIDALVVDQVAQAGGTVADHLRIPYVIVCNAMAMNPDPNIPPGVTPWTFAPGPLGRARNQLGNALLRWLARPLVSEINTARARHGLPQIAGGFDLGSRLAEIAQQPAFFDFPRRALHDCFHYTGPWHDTANAEPIAFPWENLDGRPIIYASMGTLQNRLDEVFANIAGACAGLDAQLVLSLGSRDHDAAAFANRLPGQPLVVSFAPQLALLSRASLVITHAGMNTALESLGRGLPMVAIPIANDQPGVASRLAWLGVAEVLLPQKLTVPRLRAAIDKVLGIPRYRENARRLQNELAQINGVVRAGDVIEQAFTTRKPVR